MTAIKPKPFKRSDNFVEIPPNAARTLAALRELGYDSTSAICDLIDNSIDAGAKSIDVTVRVVGESFIIEVLDDGCGMSEDVLKEAIRLGSDTEKDLKSQLGKYGMGLTTASLSIAKTIFIITREKGQHGYEATFDVSTVEKENKWVLELKPARSQMVIEAVGDYGTLVRLTNIDRLDDTNPARFTTKLKEDIGRIFRYFINDGIRIKVNRTLVKAHDPLMRDHEATEQRFENDIDLGQGQKAKLTIVELPDLGTMEEESLGIVPRKSGFYIVRNRREIMAAQTFDFYKHHHSYSHFRAELSFTGDLDNVFHVDVKKTSIHPNDRLRERIQQVARRFIEQSGREGRDRAVGQVRLISPTNPALFRARENKPETPKETTEPLPVKFIESDLGKPDMIFTINRYDGVPVVNYNKRNPLVQMVAEVKNQKMVGLLNLFTTALAEVSNTKEGQLVVDQIMGSMMRVFSGLAGSDTWEHRDKEAASRKK